MAETIEIKHESGAVSKVPGQYVAKTDNAFFVHRRPGGDPDEYSLTHVPTGCEFLFCNSVEPLEIIARLIYKRMGAVASVRDVEEFRDAFRGLA